MLIFVRSDHFVFSEAEFLLKQINGASILSAPAASGEKRTCCVVSMPPRKTRPPIGKCGLAQLSRKKYSERIGVRKYAIHTEQMNSARAGWCGYDFRSRSSVSLVGGTQIERPSAYPYG